MKIGIVGTGYVGLVTGACFAEFGVFVTCVDKDAAKIESLKQAKVPFYEPGLSELVRKNMANGRLSFSTTLADAVDGADAAFIAVGTPPRGDGSADLQYVDAVAKEIAAHIKDYLVIVTKSTVPVGTGDRVSRIISENLKDKSAKFDVVSNPEFLREGAAIEDFMRPNRVVIGSNSERATEVMKTLYKPLYLRETPFVITDVKTAELIKYASNCFLAVKISFINEMANLCDLLGADVHMVAKGMGLDGRIGSKFLHPGPGYGGSCFPKDARALLNIASGAGGRMRIVEAAVGVNEAQWELMVGKITSALGGSVKGRLIAVLGLSFKPNTDDVREAPALYIIKRLMEAGAKVRAYDPEGMANAAREVPGFEQATDAYSTAKDVDALVLVTEWNEFRNLDLDQLKSTMKSPVFLDLRNVYDPARMKAAGFNYHCVGRPVK